jgi:hypothetical protein
MGGALFILLGILFRCRLLLRHLGRVYTANVSHKDLVSAEMVLIASTGLHSVSHSYADRVTAAQDWVVV